MTRSHSTRLDVGLRMDGDLSHSSNALPVSDRISPMHVHTGESDMRAGTKEINPREILKDIRVGLSDSELMEKHGLSLPMLQEVAKELLRLRREAPQKTPNPPNPIAESVDSGVWHIRQAPRHYAPFWVSVYDESRREVGQIGDLSEQGISVEGVKAHVNEIRTFLVLADEFEGVNPIEFVAVCRWVKTEQDNGVDIAGFEIMEISEEDLVEFQKVVHMASRGLTSGPHL